MPEQSFLRQANKINPRIFMGFLDICGLYKTLEEGLKKAGFPVFFLDLGEDSYGYEKSDDYPVIPAFFRKKYWAHINKKDSSAITPVGMLNTISFVFSSFILVAWMINRFDIFIFKSGRSFTSHIFLFKILHYLGKTVIFTFHGSDSRPAYLNPVINMPDPELASYVRTQKEYIESITPYADFIIDSPLSAHFQTRKCCIRQCIFNPIQNKSESVKYRTQADVSANTLKILHAPSLPELKGSDVIRATVKKLREEGYNIDYREISGVEHKVVLREIEWCDLVIDELYSDTYGAVFALEAAAQGKPALVCGYARQELVRFVPPEAALPTCYCQPENFEAALKQLYDNQSYRKELGKKAEEYTRKWASPEAVAKRLMLLAMGQAPESWFFEPVDIRYTHGVGGTESKVKSQIHRLVEFAGSRALQVDDKPELRDQLVAFSMQN